jgi:hypothetical protein
MKSASRLTTACILLVLSGSAACADDGTVTDATTLALQANAARLKAQADLYAQQTALMTAKFGAPATPPSGSITNPEKLSAIGQWTLAAATHDAAGAVVDWVRSIASDPQVDACLNTGQMIFVTSTQDRRAGAATAQFIDNRLQAFTDELNTPVDTVSGASASVKNFALPAVLAAISGVAGTADSLAGLFRSDYTIGDLSVTADDTTLRMDVAAELHSRFPTMQPTVDALAGPTDAGYPMLSDYQAFDTARQDAATEYARKIAPLKTDTEKAKYADRKALLDAASAFDTALTTPANGQTPLVAAAIALESSGVDHCVVYVKFGTYNSSLVTRKRLLSRNDAITVVAGGIVQAAFFDLSGELRAVNLIDIDKRVAGHLTDIVGNATPLEALQRTYKRTKTASQPPPTTSEGH